MITILQQPDPIVLAGNQTILRAKTDSHLEQGALAKWDVVIPEAQSAALFFGIGTSLSLPHYFIVKVGSYAGMDIIVDPPIWGAGETHATFDAWCEHLLQALNDEPLIGRFWTITRTNNVFRFEGNTMQTQYLQTYEMEPDPWGVTYTEISNGFPPVLRDSYKMLLQVYDKDFNLLTTTGEYRVPGADGEVIFDLSDYLQATTEIEKPSATEKMKVLDSGYNVFLVQLSSTFTGSEGVEKFEIVVLPGESSFMQQALWNEEGNSFYNYITNSLQFLSSQPKYKKIPENSIELLYFFNHEARDVSLNMKVYFEDGTDLTEVVETLTIPANRIVECDVSPGKILSHLANPIAGYDLWLDSYEVAGHEVRQYRFDRNTYDQSRFYLVRNDFGRVWETVRATGECKIDTEYNRNSIEKELPLNFDTSASNIEDVENSVMFTYELNWGFLNRMGNAKDWKHYLTQVELSLKVYELIAGYMIPCKFITRDANYHQDNEDFYTHKSKYRRAYFDQAYSTDDVPVIGDFNNDYNDDYFNQ
jgi:hypothetical protein